MEQLQKLQQKIELGLSSLVVSDHPATLYEPITYFMRIGGKRIRPILTLLSAELFSNRDETVLNQAMAVELFHNFSLIHDDIMDHAPLRRGVLTVHEKWGLSQGILSGDVLLVVAYQYLVKAQPEYLNRLMDVFNKMAVEVCEGQQLDMDFEKRNDVQIEEYINMIRLKTSVLLGCALQLGAIVSDASENDTKHIYNFGVQIGIAFQIQDDILDVYADSEKFGKRVGGDIQSNKKTYLYLKAREIANPEQLSIFDNQLNNTNASEKVEIIRGLYDALQVRQLAINEMNRYYDLAMMSLRSIQVPQENKASLIAVADYLISREV